MHAEIKDFKTDWYDISVGLKKDDIKKIIKLLNALADEKPGQHFHLGSNYKGKGGISDIEFYLAEDSEIDDLSLLGFAKGE